MKKLVSLLLSVFLLGCLVLAACGTQESTTTQNPTTTTPATTTQTTTTQTTTTSGGGLTWDDMPMYSGAGQVQKGSWSIPPTEGDYTKMEWRYYETNDALEKVAAFYKSQMTSKGWEEKGWMEVSEMNWGMYNKNGENDAAMVWINSQEGKTVIAMWRATK